LRRSSNSLSFIFFLAGLSTTDQREAEFITFGPENDIVLAVDLPRFTPQLNPDYKDKTAPPTLASSAMSPIHMRSDSDEHLNGQGTAIVPNRRSSLEEGEDRMLQTFDFTDWKEGDDEWTVPSLGFLDRGFEPQHGMERLCVKPFAHASTHVSGIVSKLWQHLADSSKSAADRASDIMQMLNKESEWLKQLNRSFSSPDHPHFVPVADRPVAHAIRRCMPLPDELNERIRHHTTLIEVSKLFIEGEVSAAADLLMPPDLEKEMNQYGASVLNRTSSSLLLLSDQSFVVNSNPACVRSSSMPLAGSHLLLPIAIAPFMAS
jgi:hypothetical protein